MEDFFLRSSEGVHWGDFVFASTAPPLAATACALRQRFLLPPIVATAKGARARARAAPRHGEGAQNKLQKDKSNTLRISHRSHFGSRCKLGCCGYASLFALS